MLARRSCAAQYTGGSCSGRQPALCLERGVRWRRQHGLEAIGEEDATPDVALVGKPKPPDLSRLEWQQRVLVQASGVFVKATKARLGEATAAQFYGWQRSITGHLTRLQRSEQCLLEEVLDACPAEAKSDARGSPVPFAHELSSYLAHCDKVGGLAMAYSLEHSPFAFFFRLLNRHLANAFFEVQAERGAGIYEEDGEPASARSEPDEPDGDIYALDGAYGVAGLLDDSSDDEDSGHVGAASRFRFAALSGLA